MTRTHPTLALATLASLGLAAALPLIFPQTARAQGYAFTSIQEPDDTGGTEAFGINDAGDVTGVYAGGQALHGFLVGPGSGGYTSLDGPQGVRDTQERGANAAGDVVGTDYDSSFHPHGFVYAPGGAFADIEDPNAGLYGTQALGINDAGDVVGTYFPNSDIPHGYVYTPGADGGSYADLDVPQGYSTHATGINNAGDVAGYYNDGTGIHGFVYAPGAGGGGFTTLDDPDAADGTEALGLNAAGDVAGTYFDSNDLPHGFVYVPGAGGGTFTTVDDPLGTDPVFGSSTYAYGINDAGDVTGDYSASSGGTFGFVAFVSGASQAHPRLPSGARMADGQTVFTFTGAPSGSWVDPASATAFRYTMTGTSLFTGISDFPTGFSSPFDVSADGKDYGEFAPGQSVTFDGAGVSSFLVSGINPAVDGSSPTAFPLQVDFSTPTADFTMQAVAAPEPSQFAALALGVLGLGALALKARKRNAA